MQSLTDFHWENVYLQVGKILSLAPTDDAKAMVIKIASALA